jgi:hypothetical protein
MGLGVLDAMLMNGASSGEQRDVSLLPEAAAALADMECEVPDVVPTVGDTDLHFQAVVQVRAAVLCCNCK